MPPVQRRHTFSIGYFVLVALGLVWLQSILAPQMRQIPYSEFRQMLGKGWVEKVVLSDTLIRGDAEARARTGRAEVVRHGAGGRRPARPGAASSTGVMFRGPVREPVPGRDRLLGAAGAGVRRHLDAGHAPHGPAVAASWRSARAGRRSTPRRRPASPSTTSPAQDEAKEELQEIIQFLQGARSASGASAASCRAACCWSGRRAPARRCSPRRWPARPRCRSSRSAARSSSSCSSAWARRACATCSPRRRPRRRASSSSTSSTRSARRAASAGMTGGHDERENTLNQLLVEMDGFDTGEGRRHPRRHQPARGARSGAAARRPLRPPGAGRPARPHGPRGHPAGAREGRDAGARRRPGACWRSARPASSAPTSPTWSTRPRCWRRGSDKTAGRHERLRRGHRPRRRRPARRRTASSIPKEKQIVATHETGHALVAASRQGADPVHKISIIPRGIAALGLHAAAARPTTAT